MSRLDIFHYLSQWFHCRCYCDQQSCEERAIKAVKPDPIPSAKFMATYRQRKHSGQLGIEFKALLKNQDEHSTTAALKNVLLNNKQDVLPYDHSRVIVIDPSEPNDYYNASYIDGYNGPKEYIASQGPNTKNLSAFWHMIWQEGVTCVVMATGLFENAMQQCDKYWVDHASNMAVYGTIKVWHEQSTCLAQLNIRTFRLQKEGSCETRVLHQFEMVGLHEECPDSGLLLDVRRRVHALTLNLPGPVLVHCRCGGGRSAVYATLDYCLYQLQAEDRVDVYSAVLHLRRFRKNMVKTVVQYQQIYHAVAMYIQCGVTVYPSETLPSAYQLHYAPATEGKNHKLDREFQSLQSIVPRLSIGDCASGHRVENRSKSRDIMMLPPECARPYLNTADCGDSGTDFINAVYVDGYHTLNRYLVTQWPMKKTTADIWRLLFDFKITSLVLMNDLKNFSRSFPRFWPKEVEQVVCYGPVSVRYISCERHPDFIARTFAIRKILNNLVGCELRKDEIIVKMFQVLGNAATKNHSSSGNRHRLDNGHSRHRDRCIPDPLNGIDDNNGDGREKKCKLKHSVSIKSKSLLAVMEHVEEWQQRSQSRQPVCVMSKNGSTEAGLYCTISFCCDQLKAEKEVDVFNAVRYVRCNRPQLVPTMEEYRFIYQFMSELIRLSKSKPDIVISQPFPTFFATSDTDKTHFASATVNSSIHGGVYVTKLDGNSSPSPARGTVTMRETGSFNAVNIPQRLNSYHSTKDIMSGYSRDNTNFTLSSPHKRSTFVDQTDRIEDSNILLKERNHTTKYKFPSNMATGKMSSRSPKHPSSKASVPQWDNHDISESIYCVSSLPSSVTAPDLVFDYNGADNQWLPKHNKTIPSSSSFLSPLQCPNNSTDYIFSSFNSLCKSPSFHSCTSQLSDNSDENLTTNLACGIRSVSKDLETFERLHSIVSASELGLNSQSCSTLKDSPTEDTTISFPLGSADSPSTNTSCPSIIDSFSDNNKCSADFLKEKNNNFHKLDRIMDILKVNKDHKKPRGDNKWPFHFHKVLRWKKKEQTATELD